MIACVLTRDKSVSKVNSGYKEYNCISKDLFLYYSA